MLSVDSANATTNADMNINAQTSNGIKNVVCLVDIPMPSIDDGQSLKPTSKEATETLNTDSVETLSSKTGINSSETAQTDLQRQFHLISVPPPPPPGEPETSLISNIVIPTTRTVNNY